MLLTEVNGKSRVSPGGRALLLVGILILLVSCSSNDGQPAEESPAATASAVPLRELGQAVATTTVLASGGSAQTAIAAASGTNAPAEAKNTTTLPVVTSTTALATITPELPTRTPVPRIQKINGLAVEQFIWLPEPVKDHIREIYQQGKTLERNPRAFSKLGDSLIASPHFLTGFDVEDYRLGEYDYLQPVIEHYAGSFVRYGVAIKAGLHSWAVFDPIWADKDWCFPNEDLLACEIRLNNPSVLLILLGSNDAGAPDSFRYNVRKAAQYALDQGVIPVIYTKADRFEGPDNSNNEALRQIAQELKLPLLDFDLLAETLPNRGLQEDLVHLTIFPEYDYTLSEALQTGHGAHNLVTLMMLEAIWQVVEGEDLELE